MLISARSLLLLFLLFFELSAAAVQTVASMFCVRKIQVLRTIFGWCCENDSPRCYRDEEQKETMLSILVDYMDHETQQR